MFTLLLLIIIFLPIALLPSGLKTSFCSCELIEMGILLEDTESQKVPSEHDALFFCVIVWF